MYNSPSSITTQLITSSPAHLPWQVYQVSVYCPIPHPRHSVLSSYLQYET